MQIEVCNRQGGQEACLKVDFKKACDTDGRFLCHTKETVGSQIMD